MKSKVIQIFMVFIFAAFGFLPNAQALEYEYFGKLTQFERLTNYQFNQFLEFIRNNPQISSQDVVALEHTIEHQKVTLSQEILKLKSLYQKIFILRDATKEERKALVFQESNLSIAVHRQLEIVHGFLQRTQGASAKVYAKKMNLLVKDLEILSRELRAGESIKVPVGMGISQVFQTGRNLGKSICSLLLGFCSRASLSKLMDSLDEKNFLRADAYEYSGFDEARKTLEKNQKAVVILIGNHDQPLMDIALARNVSKMLGSDQHITMTRKSVYPIPPPESAGDVVFVVDNDPRSNPIQNSLDLLSQSLAQQKNKIVSLAVYPEGMLPYTGGQMPMTVKEGAFIIARKMAHQLSAQGVPVYLVQMKSNVIEHLTSTTLIAAKVTMQNIEVVPDSPMDRNKPDTWLSEKRLQAENSFNSHRAESQIDIFNLDKVPYSNIPYGLDMKSCSKVFIP